MTRVKVFVEGQTEETFVKNVLVPYFAYRGIYLTPILALTSPGHRGGIVNYPKTKHQLQRLCREDPSATITSMIDYYRLPTDFPGYAQMTTQPALDQVIHLEACWLADMNEPNFLPYLQLHEFEALLFCDPAKFAIWTDDEGSVATLETIKAQFDSPESINNDPNTAPSKRILATVPGYQKTLHGPIIAEDIGLDTIRRQCHHFDQWLRKIESTSLL